MMATMQSLVTGGGPPDESGGGVALGYLASFSLASSAWVWLAALHTAPGRQRLVATLPALVAYFAVPPWLASDPFLRQGITCVLSCTAFKASREHRHDHMYAVRQRRGGGVLVGRSQRKPRLWVHPHLVVSRTHCRPLALGVPAVHGGLPPGYTIIAAPQCTHWQAAARVVGWGGPCKARRKCAGTGRSGSWWAPLALGREGRSATGFALCTWRLG